MSKSFIDYSVLVDDAMHFIVKKSLQLFAKNDEHGDHHFFISFVFCCRQKRTVYDLHVLSLGFLV